ncbi:MAG: hypothetical protein E7489_08070 [Ruminococcaceae bacterium]|nr:hypothetical protein [Oscillospiraceae bacterium]
MKTFVPDYYPDFKCIAEKCRHTCCAGWEIDIDEETAEYYKTVPGKFGKRLCENIDFGEECSCFVLKEKERCPFLNKNGLCDIIINLGETALCQTCADHPRFRNFFESRTEVGLGLCCEAAAKLILEKQSRTRLIETENNGEEDIPPEEADFFALREKIFDAIFDENFSAEESAEKMLLLCKVVLPEKTFSEWAEIYLSLERLDESWTEILEKIKQCPQKPKIEDTAATKQLLHYFAFRHLAEAPFDGRLAERAAFAVLSFYITEKAAEQVGILEAARLYSSEVEYSDENIEILLNILGKKEI